MRDHNKLRAFELADEMVMLIYRTTGIFPKNEIYGLTAQIRRAAVSVPSNIVEGCAKTSKMEFRRFLEIAFGSLRELTYQYGLSSRLGYIDSNDDSFKLCSNKIKETDKVLCSLIRSLN